MLQRLLERPGNVDFDDIVDLRVALTVEDGIKDLVLREEAREDALVLARRDWAQGLVVLPARNDAVTAYPVNLVVGEGCQRPVYDNDARPCVRLPSNIDERGTVLLQVIVPA